ncbi:MAG TPA: S24 family peptidase [Pedomonas sp.]|uniref:S24 family peptidase n=1 Tax=Pedomonas sp. TaxID=2976421 RepID=UPI002F3E357E
MDNDSVRQTLDQLIQQRGDDYASLSRMLGRNPTYIQQFVKRGVPRKLDEDDRRRLAAHFGVSEQELGGPPGPIGRAVHNEPQMVRDARDYVLVPHLGHDGTISQTELSPASGPESALAFQAQWVRSIASNGVEGLSVLKVEGDSMHPTLTEGDQILVDTKDRRLRDGVFVIKTGESIHVRRLAINPVTQRVTVGSDNPIYPSWADTPPESLDIVGRVIWVGRKL